MVSIKYKSLIIFFKILFFVYFIQCNLSLAQISENKITSIIWENNALTINATGNISYAESRLKDPDRLIVDLLNCVLEVQDLEKKLKSDFDENISISEVTNRQVRIIFIGQASINRKSYLTNNEKTLIIKIARIETDFDENKITENPEQTRLEKHLPGEIKEINIEENDDKTKITISATKSIKFNTYSLKNPERLAVDLLNISPPQNPLPKFTSTPLVSGLRIGRAASGVETTRIVIDLTKDNIETNVDSNLLGNKLEINFKFNKEQVETLKRSNIKVVIDAGHGGYDTGASYGGFEEKDITFLIAEKIKKFLEASGIKVFLTREDDSFLSLAERVEIINSINPHVLISIHSNALSTSRGIRGLETYYWTSKSQKLAYYLHRGILSNVNIPDHYIRRAKFYVIRHVSTPAVLSELGFLSNHEDRRLLTNSGTQEQYAKAITEAILRFLDIEPVKKEVKDEAIEKSDKKQ